MKVVKILLKVALVLVALVVVALLTLPVWFGPVVKTVANTAVPKVVKTDFHLGHLSLNPYTARFELGDMQLWNPQGYSEKFAATVGDIAFDADTMSLMTDVIHIEEIKVKDVFVSYVSGGENRVNNFTQIQYNVAGGKEKYEAKQAQAKADKAKAESEKIEAPEEKPESGSSKKLVIDKLVINNIKFKYGMITIPVPSITLTDLGKKSNGVTFAELGDQIMQAILKSASAVGDGIKALGGAVGDGAKMLGDSAGKATKAVGESASKATKAVSESASKVTESVSNITGSGAKAVGDGAKAVGDSAGKAVDAVGEGAKKAADALKSLF